MVGTKAMRSPAFRNGTRLRRSAETVLQTVGPFAIMMRLTADDRRSSLAIANCRRSGHAGKDKIKTSLTKVSEWIEN
jgi:hypothetical protein